MPFENPGLVAEAAGQWLGTKLRIWEQEEAEEQNPWEAVKVEDRRVVNDDWWFWMKKQFELKATQESKDTLGFRSKL